MINFAMKVAFSTENYCLFYYSIKTPHVRSTVGFFCKKKKVLIKFRNKRQVQRFKNFLLFISDNDYDVEKVLHLEKQYFYFFVPQYISSVKKFSISALYNKLFAVQKNMLSQCQKEIEK